MAPVVPAAKTFALSVLVTLWAFFAPVQMMIGCVFAVVLLDFVLGISAAIRTKEPVTSAKMRLTVGKLTAYLGAILLTHVVVHGVMGDSIPLTNGVATVIALAELKSCLENLGTISGQNNFLGVVIEKLNLTGKR